ncbi:lytic transglycosylase domain-containing protein [Aliishimia ponticola]|uniref:Lytic transglycosylase domain-containing protein n=1 Tax=Aliishimia ponticola TaxID=2499833 RepID=A0A4V3XK41_9RHOB|nr:lytic transglycosylase domain-containing protein [Aliishimia ponticola]
MTVALVLLVTATGGTFAQSSPGEVRPVARPDPISQVIGAVRADEWQRARALADAIGPVAVDLVEWHRLRAGLGDFAEIRAFLDRRADWPGLDYLRRQGEPVVASAGRADVLRFFTESPAQTGIGALAHAQALEQSGKPEEAHSLIVQSWREMRLSEPEQELFLSRHKALIEPHHLARLDSMLWRGWSVEARRMYPLVSDDQQALAEARIGLSRLAGNVDTLIQRVPKALQEHPGLTHARFEWRVRKGRRDDAKQMLLAASASAKSLGRPEAWANRRRALARDELREGRVKNAYALSYGHHLTAGSHYADLEWLSGYIALRHFDDPERAYEHFDNHDSAVVSPISQGRAGYWKGLALRAMGKTAEADMEFAKGAAYQTSFYGLLAAEEAGLPFDVGLDQVPPGDWRTGPLSQDSLFQAGLMLARAGERNLAERFWAHLAEQLGEHDAAMLGQAAIDLNEPHLAVMIGKAAARRGAIIPVPYYALHPLADVKLPVATELALAIARRESEFDPVVVSGVGARGLMQLMPATAKEVAGQLGLSSGHSNARLTQDSTYNALLGTQYLKELFDRFDGNVVMISAAYNAGPSRPIRWINLYGDPRTQDIDTMVDWIENIPFRETRNYVMRVTESLPVFRARLGQDPLPVPFSKELLSRPLRN